MAVASASETKEADHKNWTQNLDTLDSVPGKSSSIGINIILTWTQRTQGDYALDRIYNFYQSLSGGLMAESYISTTFAMRNIE